MNGIEGRDHRCSYGMIRFYRFERIEFDKENLLCVSVAVLPRMMGFWLTPTRPQP